MQTCFLTPNLSIYLRGGLLEHADVADFIHTPLLDGEFAASDLIRPPNIVFKDFSNLSPAAFCRAAFSPPPPFICGHGVAGIFGQTEICADKRSLLVKGGGEPQRQAAITPTTRRIKQFLFYHSSIFALRNGP